MAIHVHLNLVGNNRSLAISASNGEMYYDSRGRLDKVVDKSEKVEMFYDTSGRLDKVVDKSGVRVEIYYDTQGRVDRVGKAEVFYDTQGRVDKVKGSTGSPQVSFSA